MRESFENLYINFDHYCFINDGSALNETLDKIQLESGYLDCLINELIGRDSNTFSDCAKYGHLDIINRILELFPNDKIDALIHKKEDEAFWEASLKCHLPIMLKLIELTPDPIKREKMIHTNNDCAFLWLTQSKKNGKFDTIEWFLGVTPEPDTRKKMIDADNGWYEEKLFFEATPFSYVQCKLAGNYNLATLISKTRSELSNDHRFTWELFPQIFNFAKTIAPLMLVCKSGFNLLSSSSFNGEDIYFKILFYYSSSYNEVITKDQASMVYKTFVSINNNPNLLTNSSYSIIEVLTDENKDVVKPLAGRANFLERVLNECRRAKNGAEIAI